MEFRLILTEKEIRDIVSEHLLKNENMKVKSSYPNIGEDDRDGASYLESITFTCEKVTKQ